MSAAMAPAVVAAVWEAVALLDSCLAEETFGDGETWSVDGETFEERVVEMELYIVVMQLPDVWPMPSYREELH